MFDNIMRFFKKTKQNEDSNLIATSSSVSNSKEKAKERLHLVLMQDRVNVSADFLDLMKQEIIDVIKKYIDIDEAAMDVSFTNKENEDGTQGTPALYANIPILNIKDETRKIGNKKENKQKKEQENPPKKEENSIEEKKESLTDKQNEERVEEIYIKEEVTETKEKEKVENEKKAVNE